MRIIATCPFTWEEIEYVAQYSVPLSLDELDGLV